MRETKRVVVTGLGVISSVGNNKKDFWKAITRGESGIGPLTSFDCSLFKTQIAGEVKGFDPLQYINPKEVKHTEKFVQYAIACSKMAFQESGLDMSKENPDRCGVIIGCGVGSLRIMEEQYDVFKKKGPKKFYPFMIPMLIVNMASGQVSIELGFKGPNLCTTTACASGNHAIGDAFRILERGDADIIAAGGTESCITALGMGGFCALRALSTRNNEPKRASRPFDKERDGFVVAEGCGILILEEMEHAKKRGATIYSEIVGFGMNGDAYHITAPDPSGEGARKCMKLAIEDARLNPEEIDYINAHGTSTSLNDKIETLAIKNLFKSHAKKLMISSTKSMTGHALGAAGGMEAIVCCLTIKEGIVTPTINYEFPDPECGLDYVPNKSRKVDVEVALSNSFGFGGHNAAVVFKKFK
ncbi:MAG: beta-ketoacyl-[acyl-carrier-protein] synthase II [Candidatus Omnitrophica bacterium CG07_land_8_20_14_0_80_42_15]|uniref:3-oxoacyl-[acyl-carrier-protein] synthase 2 n=1 Tax=Candidatus Aquitaenariimonas noxiae TaxID=1974741 RepID=A0A2J0L0S6_9BACT|nr:MAG: beta-ketoacyl-[acyl-carrier-protein] synthase II [Candidatus Omnitrophica bacterium CG07_land_8_20_14_0_80_42_15]